MSIIAGLFGSVVKNAEGILDKVITTDKERDAAKIELKKILLEAEREAFAKEVEDRKSARNDKWNNNAVTVIGGFRSKKEAGSKIIINVNKKFC